MGDGLKRAFAAAARTRADASLTPEMVRFLRSLPADGTILTVHQVPGVVTRAVDRARQACRRFGYAWMATREDGKKGWQITADGRRALEGAFGFRSGKGDPSALPVLAGRS